MSWLRPENLVLSFLYFVLIRLSFDVSILFRESSFVSSRFSPEKLVLCRFCPKNFILSHLNFSWEGRLVLSLFMFQESRFVSFRFWCENVVFSHLDFVPKFSSCFGSILYQKSHSVLSWFIPQILILSRLGPYNLVLSFLRFTSSRFSLKEFVLSCLDFVPRISSCLIKILSWKFRPFSSQFRPEILILSWLNFVPRISYCLHFFMKMTVFCCLENRVLYHLDLIPRSSYFFVLVLSQEFRLVLNWF